MNYDLQLAQLEVENKDLRSRVRELEANLLAAKLRFEQVILERDTAAQRLAKFETALCQREYNDGAKGQTLADELRAQADFVLRRIITAEDSARDSLEEVGCRVAHLHGLRDSLAAAASRIDSLDSFEGGDHAG